MFGFETYTLQNYIGQLTFVVHGIEVMNIKTIDTRNTFDLCNLKNSHSSITDDITASNCTN